MNTSWKAGLLVLLLLVTGVGVYLYDMYQSVEETVEQIYVPLPAAKSPWRKTAVSIKEQEPIVVLLMGVDERENDRGRSDTLILLCANPRLNRLLMLNIPRDTRTLIGKMGKEDKMNHAYAYGGIPLTVETIEMFLQVPIDFYVTVNMEGFSRVIDSLGGIDVENYMSFEYDNYNFPEGLVHMDGAMALAYTRMRYYDPKGDAGRNKRQQRVIKAILAKANDLSVLQHLDGILQNVKNHVKTNVRFSEIKELLGSYRTALHEIETDRIRGEGKVIDGIYYYLVKPDERHRIQKLFQSYLDNTRADLSNRSDRLE